jgi:hypothetical protein
LKTCGSWPRKLNVSGYVTVTVTVPGYDHAAPGGEAVETYVTAICESVRLAVGASDLAAARAALVGSAPWLTAAARAPAFAAEATCS